jgi:tRNA A-37 threonylcarbamoyl transferase component Bud32
VSDQYIVQPGTIFAGDFRVDRALSQGGMGAVYVAEQLSTGKQRALKVMLAALVSDPALRKRFEQEARIGSMIESEHVVEVVGAGIDQHMGLPWLAMELLQGEDLDHVVMARGPLPIHEVAQLFQQLCHAVGAAHRVGVVHRDLKPENVFLAKARRADATFMVKVLDFGIAKIVAEASTKQTAAMGSPIWMAPEQADQSPITPATDVWALGLIAFFLLTGRPFWRSANDETSTIPMVLKEVLFEPILPASVRTAELGRALPPGFDEWFSHCVARDPAHRFPDATQAGAALVSLLGGAAHPPAGGADPYAATIGPYGGGSAASGSGPVAHPAPHGTAPMHAVAAPSASYPPAAPTGSGATGTPGSYTIPGSAGQPAPPKKMPAWVMGVAGVFVLGVIGGAVALGMRHGGASGTTGTSGQVAGSGAEASILADAKKLSDDAKYDQAHQRLAQIPASSEARQSPVFKDIEQKWANETLQLADRTADVGTKRVLLEGVAQSATVDDSTRATAKERLAALDGDAGGGNVNLSRATLHGPGHTPSNTTGNRTIAELAGSTNPIDWASGRKAAEPRVKNGSATVEEATALQTICKKLHDHDCAELAKSYLKSHR